MTICMALVADTLASISAAVRERSKGFSERRADEYLRAGAPTMAAAEGKTAAPPAAPRAGTSSAGAGCHPIDTTTSALLIAAANQLEVWLHYPVTGMCEFRREFLVELIPELRTRADMCTDDGD